jgi:hypothetical protein
VGNTTINYDYEAASPAVEVSAIMKWTAMTSIASIDIVAVAVLPTAVTGHRGTRRRHDNWAEEDPSTATHTARLQDPNPGPRSLQYPSYHYVTTYLVIDRFSNIYTILANFIFHPL